MLLTSLVFFKKLLLLFFLNKKKYRYHHFFKFFTRQIQRLPSFDLEPHWRDIRKLCTKYFCYIITMRIPLKIKKEELQVLID